MKIFKKTFLVVLSCLLVLCVAVTLTSTQTSNADDYTVNWGMHELAQQTDYNLRDGGTESQFISYGTSAQGVSWYSHSVANYYDLSKVTVLTSYKNYDEFLKNGQYAMSTVLEQANYVSETYGWDVLGGVNGAAFDTGSGAPVYGLMINGVEYTGNDYRFGFFAIMYDSNGTQKAVIGRSDEWTAFSTHKRGQSLTRTENGVVVDYTDYEVEQAIGGWGGSWSGVLLYDGEYDSVSWDEEHPRTAIGIKADGTVVTYVCEGRNAGRAGGMSTQVMASIMKELGCVYAMNLDGGGSSTALSRHEGETTYSNRIEAAYGEDRSVASAILFVSTASYNGTDTDSKEDTTFARAQISPNGNLYISGTTINFTATGSNAYGDPVDLPSGLTWALGEDSTSGIGTIDPETGVFKATSGKVGHAVINLCQGDTVVGTTTVSLDWPSWCYSNSFTTTFSVGCEEEQQMYFYLYPSGNNDGISAYRPFVIQDGDLEWNLPTDCSVVIKGEYCYFVSGNVPILDAEVYITKITGTGQTSGTIFNALRATVSVGKAPELLYDFEDDSFLEEIGRGGNSSTSIYRATAETGKVLFGESSLAITYDFSNRNYIAGIDPSKSNNGTINWYNDNQGFNPVIPADATYFGYWLWVPEGMDGCWLRATLQGYKSDGSKGTATMTLTDFISLPKNAKVDQGTSGGEWRFYYGKLGTDNRYATAWTISGPYSIYYVQIMWSAFADTTLGYDYQQADSAEEKEAARQVIEEKFNMASKGTIYIDNVMALYGRPTSDMLAPYISQINAQNTDSSSTITFNLLDEDRYDTNQKAAIKYDEVTTLGELLSISGVDFSTLTVYLNGSAIDASKISVNTESGLVTISNLATLKSGDTLRVVARDYYLNQLDKTYTLQKISYVSGVATKDDTATTTDYYVFAGSSIEGVEAPTPATVDHDGYYFTDWIGGLPSTMPNSDIVIVAKYSNLYQLTIKEAGTDNVVYSGNVAYGTTLDATTLGVEREGYTFAINGSATMPAQKVETTCSYTVNSYKLSFTVDGKDYGTSTQVAYGSAITLPTVEAKEGYTFAWSNDVSTMPASDLTIAGAYTINSYKVTFKDGDDVVAEKTLNYGALITLPEITGYDVAFASDDHATTVPVNGATIAVTLTARKHTLTINVGNEQYSANSVDYGTEIVLPTKTGYTAAWVTEDVLTTMPDEDVTLVVEFTINSYKVTFKDGDKVVAEETLNYGAAIALPEITGYDIAFVDEYHIANVPANDVEIAVTCTAHKHTLTIKVGEDTLSEKSVEYGTTITLPKKTGYTASWVTENAPETMPDEDLTLVAQFTVNTYTVKFLQDEVVVAEEELAYGAEITLPEITGYDVEFEDQYHTTNVPLNGATIGVILTVRTHTLTIKVDEETISEKSVEYGTAITLPSKTGYTASWVTEDAPETMPDKDLTLVAKFTVNTYTVKFVQDDDDVVAEEELAYGAEIVLPEITGYDVSFAEEYHVTNVPVNGILIAVTLTPHKNKLTIKVGDTVLSENDVAYGTTLSIPEKIGYTGSWVTEEAPETMPDEELILVVEYKINSYTVAFVENEIVVAEKTLEYGATIELPEITGYDVAFDGEHETTVPANNVEIAVTTTVHKHALTITEEGTKKVLYQKDDVDYGTTLVIPEKTGYTGLWVTENVPETMPDKDLSVVAKYTINSYKVTFKSGNTVALEKTLEYGAAIELPEIAGYEVAWASDTHATVVPANDIELQVLLTIKQYTLSFVVDGAVVGAMATVDYGASLSQYSYPTLYKTGYTLTWTEIPATMPAKDLAIVGTFTINQYKLTFIVDDVVADTATLEYGATITYPDQEKEGYTFSWNTQVSTMPANNLVIRGSHTVKTFSLTITEEGTDTVLYYNENQAYGSAITLPAKTGYTASWVSENVPATMPTQDVELVAKFTINSYKLSFVVDGETIKQDNVEYNTAISLIDNQTKVGYTFAWSEIPATMPANDLTVVGTFTVNQYKVTYKQGKEVIAEEMKDFGSAIELPVIPGYSLEWASKTHATTVPSNDVEVQILVYVLSHSLKIQAGKELIVSTTLAYGATIEIPEREGYKFVWLSPATPVETMPDSDLTIVGQYLPAHTLTFTVDGEVYGEPVLMIADDAITLPTVEEKEGYTFSWVNAVATMPDNDLTIAGVYTINGFTLTIKIGDEVYGETLTLDYGAAITLPTSTKTGYTIVWQNAVDTMPAASLTISGSYAVDTVYVASKVTAAQNATSVEERFAAIKDAEETFAIYTEQEKAQIQDSINQMEAIKAQYTATATTANADMTTATNVITSLMSTLAEMVVAAAVAIVIKRRLF